MSSAAAMKTWPFITLLWALSFPAQADGITEQVRNAYSCLPSLADPPDEMVLFKDGKYSSPSIPLAEMRAMASGTLDGKTAAVVEIVWNTGGSGNWEIVALYRLMNGTVTFQGVYWPAADLPDGGTMVRRIEIKHDKIHLFGEDPLHHRIISKPLVVTSSVFERCRTTDRR